MMRDHEHHHRAFALSPTRPSTIGLIGLIILSLVAPGATSTPTASYGDLLRQGNAHYTSGEFVKAEESYLRAQNEKPAAAAPRFNIGNTYFLREDYPRSIEHYLEALDLLQGDRELEVRIRYNLATARVKESEKTIGDLTDSEKIQTALEFLEQAIGGYRDVLEIDPDHPDARHNLALAQLRIKKLLDDLKKLREQEEQDQEEGQSPVEILRELIEEEEAEIRLTTEVLDLRQEEGMHGQQLERVEEISRALEGIEPTSPATEREAVLRSLRELEEDPGFELGAAELSGARRALEKGAPPGAELLEASRERIESHRDGLREQAAEKLTRDLEDQGQTLAKARGLVQGLQAQLDGPPPPPPGGAAPGPQPSLPPEAIPVVKKIIEKTGEAASKMEEALKALRGEASTPESSLELAARILRDDSGKMLEAAFERARSKTDSKDPLDRALGSQLAALGKLHEALEEAKKLPGQEPEPQEGQPQESDDESGERQEGEQQEGQEGENEEQGEEGEKGEDEEQGEGEQQDPEQSGESEESGDSEEKEGEGEEKPSDELSEEEARRLLQKFLEHDARRERDKKRREMKLRGRGRRSLEKDW